MMYFLAETFVAGIGLRVLLIAAKTVFEQQPRTAAASDELIEALPGNKFNSLS
jgi:hypothetical protein